MTAGDPIPSDISGRWQTNVVLKRDIFSTVERGTFSAETGLADAVLRRLDTIPWWTRPLARHFLRQEARALAAAKALKVAPELLFATKALLVRRFIDGVPLHIARPIGDRAFFHSAREALRRLHRTGITHNDLAKEQNWLRAPNGRAYLTDFQLAMRFKRRNKLFRVAAYEDLRHMLKHKRSYVPEALTAAERRILARKSWLTRIWMATGKKVYMVITRGVFRFVDREGGGVRLVTDAPTIAAMFKSIPDVRDVAVVAFPDRRAGTGLYAFIEAGSAAIKERNLHEFITAAVGKQKAPERIQVVDALPRAASGEVRKEILQLVAMNQLDLIGPLISADDDRGVIDRIVAGRRNLRDRFTF
jgi:hypothetical protein